MGYQGGTATFARSRSEPPSDRAGPRVRRERGGRKMRRVKQPARGRSASRGLLELPRHLLEPIGELAQRRGRLAHELFAHREQLLRGVAGKRL